MILFGILHQLRGISMPPYLKWQNGILINLKADIKEISYMVREISDKNKKGWVEDSSYRLFALGAADFTNDDNRRVLMRSYLAGLITQYGTQLLPGRVSLIPFCHIAGLGGDRVHREGEGRLSDFLFGVFVTVGKSR